MGIVKCFRIFAKIHGDKWIMLDADWDICGKHYKEHAAFGIDGSTLAFWSFTSDGKRSEGRVADGTDVHPKAVAFEAQMPAGIARRYIGPVNTERSIGPLNQKQKRAGTDLLCITTLRQINK